MSPALRRHGTTLVLTALAAGMGVAVFVERGSVSTSEELGRRRNLLPAFRGDDVSEISVQAEGRRRRRGGRGSKSPSSAPRSASDS